MNWGIKMSSIFNKVRDINDVALNILRQRYFKNDETTWDELVTRVVDYVWTKDLEDKELVKDMITNLYFIPNSPCLVNAGNSNRSLAACYVIDFKDTIEDIYKTKLNFALIARKGGGCGTNISKIRPEGSIVRGSTHGYAGGPIKFADTISKDMEVLSQGGFRSMAIMFSMSIYHPDILRFIFSKVHDGRLNNANLSIIADDFFMHNVEYDSIGWHRVKHDKWGEGFLVKNLDDDKYYPKLKQDIKKDDIILSVGELFNFIVDSVWRNGEPGIVFENKMNNSPYTLVGQKILGPNVCGEQLLPDNGICTLGSLDISKFLYNGILDLEKLELAVRLGVRFLDSTYDVNSYPTKEIEDWAINNRSIGLGIMGFADYLLSQKIEYGSKVSCDLLEFILNFIYKIAEDESIILGKELGIPEECKKLPVPRRNITLLTGAPTGSVSLLAGCSSSIEPIFSEVTIRNDNTGTYQFENDLINEPYFKCAVSRNGGKEVTWEEHLAILNSAQRFIDSGQSKTINCPQGTKKITINKILIAAWKSPYIKGLTIYRNGSREKEVLSPKNLKKDLCPYCESEMVKENGCTTCINKECQFSYCEM